MKKSGFQFCDYTQVEGVSSDGVSAILQWAAADLGGQPEIFVMGRSAEESERLRKYLEERLTNHDSQTGP